MGERKQQKVDMNPQQELDDLEAAFRGRSGELFPSIGSMLNEDYGIFGYWITEVAFVPTDASRPEFVSHRCIKTPDGGYKCGIYGLSTNIREFDDLKAQVEEPEQVTKIFRERGAEILSDVTELVAGVLGDEGYEVTHIGLGPQRPGSTFCLQWDGGFKLTFTCP